MAHSPEKKAAAVADIVANGLTWEQAMERHGVGKATLSRWVSEMKTEPKRNQSERETEIAPLGAEARKARFDAAFFEFLMSTVTMLRSIAETCADPVFIQTSPEGVNDLANTVFDKAERIMAVIREEDARPEARPPEALR